MKQPWNIGFVIFMQTKEEGKKRKLFTNFANSQYWFILCGNSLYVEYIGGAAKSTQKKHLFNKKGIMRKENQLNEIYTA